MIELYLSKLTLAEQRKFRNGRSGWKGCGLVWWGRNGAQRICLREAFRDKFREKLDVRV